MNFNANGKNIDIAAIRNIDREAFKAIIDMHYKEVYLYARSLTRDEDFSKDLVQDVFFRLWEKRGKLREGVVIKGWLFTSVHNKFIDHVRKHKKEVYLLEEVYAETVNEVVQENQDELRHKLKIVEKEIGKLPKKCHKVFILSKKEGLVNDEIAKHLGISVKTVEGHLTNAFKILREKLKEKIQFLTLIIFDI